MVKNSIYLKCRALFVKLYMSMVCYRMSKGAFGHSYKRFISKDMHKYKQLLRFNNIHKGESCFIIGTGPSLTSDDINKLKDKFTIGVNTLYKLYEKTDFRADYYCVIDPSTFGDIQDDLEKYKIENLFYASNRIKKCKLSSAIPFALDCSSFYTMLCPEYYGYTKFSDDIVKGVYDGASVVYAAIQLAVYMGFDKIYLLGVDCNYDKSEELHASKLGYSKDYKYNWTKQTGSSMINGFSVAQEYALSNDIKIYNATKGGMLEVFPRVDLDEVLGGKYE